MRITLREVVIVNADEAFVANPTVVGGSVERFGIAERHVNDVDEVVLIDIGETGENGIVIEVRHVVEINVGERRHAGRMGDVDVRLGC